MIIVKYLELPTTNCNYQGWGSEKAPHLAPDYLSAQPKRSAPPKNHKRPTFRGQIPFVEGLVVFICEHLAHLFENLGWGARKILRQNPKRPNPLKILSPRLVFIHNI